MKELFSPAPAPFETSACPPSLSTIQRLLLRLGATPNYAGFRYTAEAVLLAAEDQRRLLLVTKHIYPAVASRHRVTCSSVERNIRTVIQVVWRSNSGLLHQLAGYQLPAKPSSSQFLAILAAAFPPAPPV